MSDINFITIKADRHDTFIKQLKTIENSLFTLLIGKDNKLLIDENKKNRIEVKINKKSKQFSRSENKLLNNIDYIIQFAKTHGINIRYKK